MSANKAAVSVGLACCVLETSPVNGWESLSGSQVPPQWQRLPFFDTSIKLMDSPYLPARQKWTEPPRPSVSWSIRAKTQRAFQEFISCTSKIRLLRWWGVSQGSFLRSLQVSGPLVYTSSEIWSYLIYYLFQRSFGVQPQCNERVSQTATKHFKRTVVV